MLYIVKENGFLAQQNGLGAVFGALGSWSLHKEANRLSKQALKQVRHVGVLCALYM